MALKAIKGELEYVTDNVGVEGKETFYITCHDDGTRLLRATSLMFNDNIVRDTLLTVGVDWQPIEAHLKLIKGNYNGSALYLFEEKL